MLYKLRYTGRSHQYPNRPSHVREEVIIGLKSKNIIAREGRNIQRHSELSTPNEWPSWSRRNLPWTVLHLCAMSPQLGQACAQIGMETALHRSHWAIRPLCQLLGLCHSRIHTAQGMLSVQIKVTTNWLFFKSLPGCSCWAVVGGTGAYSKTA